MVMIVNRYAKHCAVCGVLVGEGEGFARLEPSQKWFTYCKKHTPEQKKEPIKKGPATPAPAVDIVAPKKEISGTRKLYADGRIVIEPWKNDIVELALLKSMPGRHYHPEERYWTVSTDPSDRKKVIEFANRLKLDIDPAWNAEETRAKAAQKRGLYNYQVDGVEWLNRQTRAILADDMGLGKTIESIMALENNDAVLVICPANVKYNWKGEFAVWRPEYKVTVISGRDNFRFPERGEAVIINYDILPEWLVPEKKDKKEEKYIKWAPENMLAAKRTTLICDEAHAVRSSKAKRTKQVRQLSYKCKKVWFLTGTPLVNRVNDLLGLLFTLNRFHDTFGTFDNFVKMFNIKHNGYGHDWDSAVPSPEVPNILRRVMLRRLREKVLPELPEMQHQTILLDVNSKIKAMLDVKWEECKDKVCNHKVLPEFKDFSRIRKEIAEDRIPVMLEIVENFEEQNTPLVVYSAHKGPIAALAERDGWETITGETPAKKRQEIIDAFQAGRLKGLGLTIQAGGVGTNLTYAWTALLVDLDWTPGLNEQAVYRLLRIGQKNNVRILHMVSNHPLDIHLHDLLFDKNATIRKTVN